MSATYTMPLASTAIEAGILNWPGPAPVAPQDLMNFPFLSNLATRALAYPSGMKMLPAASQATSVGWLKLSPATPDPGGPDARPNTPLLPSSPTASSLRPNVRRTLPDWSNLTTILDARSTIQTLFCGSTLTPCANRNA